ncbi:hypothetical protein [Maribacter dokdonensis]|uniref:hypothetical protein n=1 Tax=Maribacter dokdonensis TaxID=320912 RepID=UPI001C08819B|nr:hypothetical protein [Maribacter dokdonensis]MBU2902934.1 hypothetical protein [Maribacter dokdonensis]
MTALNNKLNPLKDGAITKGKVAYLLFDDTKTNLELFLPNSNEGLVMPKTNEGNWSNGDYKLIAWKGYVLQKNGQAIYGGMGN